MSSIFRETCKLLSIKTLNSTAYHHQTLGALENSHKSLGAYLRMQIAKNPVSWSSWVPFWCFSNNTSVHTSTKYTPFELVFGKTAKLPSNVLTGRDPVYNFDNYPIELRYRLQEACKEAQHNLIASKGHRKEKYDVKSKPMTYECGEKVMLRNSAGTKREAIYEGPYTVLSVEAPNICLDIKNKPVVVHKNRLKKYYS